MLGYLALDNVHPEWKTVSSYIYVIFNYSFCKCHSERELKWAEGGGGGRGIGEIITQNNTHVTVDLGSVLKESTIASNLKRYTTLQM